MATKAEQILNTIKNAKGKIPYSYVVGGKDTPTPIPFDVLLRLDPDFKKTLLKVSGIVAGGIALGTIAGFVISHNLKNK